MGETLLVIAGTPVTAERLCLGLAGASVLLLLVVAVLLARANRLRAVDAFRAAEREDELDHRLASLSDVNAQLTGRVQTMAEVLSSRQADLARFMADRLDAVGTKVGQGLERSARATGDNLSRLNERLAVIDAAQARLTGLTEEVVALKDILANKQTRGAFGQGRMEAIVRDGLPSGTFAFQASLSNGTRPDCLIRLPGDDRGLVIDAKFPLESLTALKAAGTDEERRQAAQRVRGDFGKHVKAIAERYLLPGETQDIAVLFLPSESIYADLNEHFDDVVQKALRQRIMIVSPSLLMMAIQVMQTIVRDVRMRDQAHIIQAEVRKLLDEVDRMRDRVAKLDAHFRQAQDDVAGIVVSAGKVAKRAGRIDDLEFLAEAPAAADVVANPAARLGRTPT